ncbi:hypothetical protein BDZ45DRAFT_709511 [Acephala macrosclerotiorum]|nr:hypothetical protein BDZ45DRAFT_709511 [Acephala macrosclerotiorum]
MPRPKRPGAPEPKRRSRNGCHPCKGRKVKCDETKPVCNNCKKLGEACDYSMRLKWGQEDRTGPEPASRTPTIMQTNTTAASFSGSPRRTGTSKTSIVSPLQTQYGGTGLGGQVELVKDEPQIQEPSPASSNTFSNHSTPLPHQPPSDSSLIDPALMSSPAPIATMFQDSTFEGLPSLADYQYNQSYERYRSATPGTPGAEPSHYGRPLKRMRYTGDHNNSYDMSMPPPNSIISHESQSHELPTLNTAKSDRVEGHYKIATGLVVEPDLRRLSVSSLLSGPPGIPYQNDYYQDTTTWGIDRGFKDLDIGKNDDANAISGSSPVAKRDHLEFVLDDEGHTPPEFGFGMETNNTALDSGNYYDKPVAINIPRVLEPLPNKLLENPMNLLHHFLNHTAGCLIPQNCSSNPFKNILPQMAVRDDNLLNLLLAYSASHRARLLRQPEPATRIAMYVRDIFPNLRRALDDPNEVISNSTLATAIMLASLEIISPTAFGIEVPWQSHLGTAREIIAARGGPQNMRSVALNDKVVNFLWSWFAYLDVLGSLSGGKGNASWIFDYECREENEYAIDCILGFTSRCVRLLAKIAELSRICDSERIGPNLKVRPEWKPSEEFLASASKLESDLAESRLHPIQPCTHMQSTGEAAYQWDSSEMKATNEAFHWAGLVHLHRRILGKPSTHEDVQKAVREIFGALYKVRRGSSADVCLLFPMFTAGCETQNEKQRVDILERMMRVEKYGMTQVHKARTLMERVWEKGMPWETLVAGEFFG